MLSLAFSPCPNDTFLFYAWTQGKVGNSLPCEVTLADIQTLNDWALQEKFPLIKVSVACFKKIQAHYNLLPLGAALGYGVGPKVIAGQKRNISKTDRVAIPGEGTTAHTLFAHFYPDHQEKIFCTYDQVLPLLREGKVDLGVIIHETRFTFLSEGFHEVADLGTLWEEKYALPLPLGCLVAHKSLGAEKELAIIQILEESLAYAYNHPEEALNWVLEHAQEKKLEIVKKHIDLYLSPQPLTLAGKQAIHHFLTL